MKTDTITMVLIAISFAFAAICHATPIANGDFAAGLDGWQSEGDVNVESEAAVLGDDGDFYSLLYQPVALDAGAYTFEFDFMNSLSQTVDPGTFPDTAFVTLYFVDDVSQLDVAGGLYDDYLAILDLDYMGPFNVNGSIESSVVGPEWSHLTVNFENSYNYVVPAFELLDSNFVNNDSNLLVDNVAVSIIPEPGTLVILASGLLLQTAYRRWRA